MDTTQLAAEARAAYDQNRIRECIALTKTLALADPGNSELQTLQAAIRAEIHQDVHDARTLLEQSGTSDEKKKYRKAAEIILIKTINMDPDNDEAKALLQSTRAVPGMPAPQPAAKEHKEKEKDKEHSAHSTHWTHPPQQPPPVHDELSFVAAPALFKSLDKLEKKKSRLKFPLGVILTIVVGGGLLRIAQSHQANPTTLAAPLPRTESLSPFDLQGNRARSTTSSVPSSLPSTPTVTQASVQLPASAPQTTVTAGAASLVAANSTPAAPNSTPATPAVAAPAAQPTTGNLAVSSPTAAEIYQGGKYLGSTPTTLQLPAGRQTLEYRHGDLRTVVNHDIKSNQTTAASVTFQMTVQVNAKPWAQVFLDGAQRRPLGQTPLSNVSVPIGGVLLFENPNFASKTYRITEKDTAIQVDFQ